MSLRNNKYKKKLTDQNTLLVEAPKLHLRFSKLLNLLDSCEITQAQYALLYFLNYHIERYGYHFLGSIRPPLVPAPLLPCLEVQKFKHLLPEALSHHHRLAHIDNLWEILNCYSLKSTPLAALRALIEWERGNYHLKLFTNIPTPLEVLQMQKNGHRCVTTPVSEKMLSHYILGERDGLSFFIHDLVHADHFFFENNLKDGQIGFYILMNEIKDHPQMCLFLQIDSFSKEFDYLISDMNAYCVHLMKGFKAILKKYNSSSVSIEDILSNIFKMNEHQKLLPLLQKLNTPDFNDPEDTLEIEYFLVQKTKEGAQAPSFKS